MKKCVVLTSGGLDSSTTLAIAKSLGFEIYAITFDYKQRHIQEIIASKKIVKYFKIKKHIIFKIDLRKFGGSALTENIPVPKNRNLKTISNEEIPLTYVPARNTVFLSLALAWAETLKITDIFIGVNALDYSGYPDCRPEFIKSFEKTANLATKIGVMNNKIRIHTPLIKLSKAQIIKKGIALGVDYGLTSTCYSPLKRGIACGKCDACILRLKGFKELNINDPIKYDTRN